MYILSNADASVLSIVIAAFIILFAVGSFFKVERELPYSTPIGILAGLVVGVLLPTTGVAGSLVMLYLMTKQLGTPHTVRAAMAFFLVMLMTSVSIALVLRGARPCSHLSALTLLGIAVQYPHADWRWRSAQS